MYKRQDLKRCGGKTYTSDAVTLMTLHASKGLEFPAVMICGADQGMIPLETDKGETDKEEERRLFFVGMTRAKEELILISTETPSEFLAEDVYKRQSSGKLKRPEGFPAISCCSG